MKTKPRTKSAPGKREVFLVIKEPLLGWLEKKAEKRGDSNLQPTIYDLLRDQRERDLAKS